VASKPNERAPSAEPDEPAGGADGARKPFLLRLPAPLMAELRAWAAHEVRSLNGQIEFVLKEAVRQRKSGG
jgi:hypothetical protein